MFKSARWRNEKNKLKVVFGLQFHATQVPQVLGNALIVSLIPADVGKPTMRLEKATVHDGSCYWVNPVFETVRLVQEPRTGKLNEKVYHFQISNGSSKASIIGEVSIDFADYVGAIKPFSISLPLKNSKFSAVLHVLIQRMLENDDQREIEESEKPEEKSLKNSSNGDIKGIIHGNSLDDVPHNESIPDNAELNGIDRAFNGSTDTMSSFDSSPGFDTPRELAWENNESHHCISSRSSVNHNSVGNKPQDDASSIIDEAHQRSQCEWSLGSDHKLCTEDSPNDIGIEQLKSDLLALARRAEVSELELQSLRKQIVKESKKGQDLLREVNNLKEERDELKVKNKLGFEGGDMRALVEELSQELNHERDLNANLRLQLQKTQEANSQLILAVQDLDEMLESNKKDKDVPNLETDDEEEQKELEDIVKEHDDAKEVYLLEQKIMDLCSEIQIYRRDKNELEIQMEQLALDYEILNQEKHDMSYKLNQSQVQEQLKIQYECSDSFAMMNDLESWIENLDTELKSQSKELSDSLSTVDELKTQVRSLESELERQAERSLSTKNEVETHVTRLEEELEKQVQGSLITIDELETHVKSLEEELEKQAEGSLSAIEEVETHVKRLEEELEKQAQGSLATINELKTHVKSLEEELEKQAHRSLSTIDELGNHVKCLEEELEQHAQGSLTTIDELETHVKRLEEELETLEQRSLVTIDELETHVKRLEEELETQRQGSVATINEVETHVKSLEKELETQAQGSLSTTDEFKSHVRRLEEELETQTRGSLATIDELKILVKSLEEELETQAHGSISTIDELRTHAKRLEEELETQRRGSLATIDELETHVMSLEEELETQTQAYEADMDDLIKAKVEQEKRAILAEEALRTTRWKSAKTAERLQKEFKALSMQMSSNFNANEKLAMEALEEAHELRQQKDYLEKMLHKADDELRSLKREYEVDRDTLRAEVEQMKTLMEDIELLLQRKNVEKTQMEETIALVRNEADKSVEELYIMRCLRDEKDTAVENLQLQLNALMTQLNGHIPEEDMDKSSTTRNYAEPATVNSGEEISQDDMLKETTLLKQRNITMQGELKEMQERYSQISLKFAEVEGERQRLLMKVRSLKNSRKS